MEKIRSGFQVNLCRLVVFALIFAPVAQAADLCSRDAKNIDARIELTQSGVGKIVESITNDQLPNIADAVKGLRFDDISFGPEKKDCSKKKLDAMTTAAAWETCFGFPAMLKKNGANWGMLLKPEPSNFSLTNFYLKEIKFGEMKIIPCDDGSDKTDQLKNICYDLPIPSLALGGTLDMKSQFSGETLFRMNRWNLNINTIKDSGGNPLIPHVKLKAIVNEDGSLKKILQTDENFTKAMLPSGAVSLSMDLSDAELDELTKKIMIGIYDDFQPTLSLPNVSSEEKIKYWNDHPEVVSANQNRFGELFWKQLKIYMGPNFDSEESLSLFLAGKIVLDKVNSTIKFSKEDGPMMKNFLGQPMEKVSEFVTQVAMPIISQSVNSYMQSMPFLHKEYVDALPPMDIQDALDSAQFEAATKQRLDVASNFSREVRNSTSTQDVRESIANWADYVVSMRDYRNAFAKNRDPSSIHFLDQVLKAWEDNFNQLKSKCTDLVADGKMKPQESKAILEQEKAKLEIVRKSLKQTADEIIGHWNDAIDPMFLRTVAAQMGTANKTIELAVSMCTLCSAFDTVGTDPSKLPQFKREKDYDIGTQVSFEFINNYLKIQHARKVFDLCVHEHPVDTCANASWFSINKYAELQDAPRVGRDEKGLYIVGSKLKYGASFVHLQDRKSTRLNSSHLKLSRMPSSA